VAALKLFQAILDTPTGVVFSIGSWDEVKPQGRIQLALEDLLAELPKLATPDEGDPDYPFVLAAGERRSFTANTIMRDP
jgi:hypothetical protein